MKTLCMATQKGGEGKTATTCHLAFDLAERGLRVVVLDFDTQRSASLTLRDYKSGLFSADLFDEDTAELRRVLDAGTASNLVLIEADMRLANVNRMMSDVDAVKALKPSMDLLAEHFDVCLVDTPPQVSNLVIVPLVFADFVLSPIRLEPYSLQGLEDQMLMIQQMQQVNPKLSFMGFFPSQVALGKPRLAENEAALKAQVPNLVLPFTIGMRDSIGEAMGDGIPVWKIKKTAARDATREVRAMAQYVYEHMEIAQ